MLLASLMREGCRVKVRLLPGEEKRFFAQLSIEARDSSILLAVGAVVDAEVSTSETQDTSPQTGERQLGH